MPKKKGFKETVESIDRDLRAGEARIAENVSREFTSRRKRR